MQPTTLNNHTRNCSGASLKRQHEQCVAVTRLLEEDLGDAAAAQKWREQCTQKYPFSRFFGGSRTVVLNSDYVFDGMVEAFGLLSFK